MSHQHLARWEGGKDNAAVRQWSNGPMVENAVSMRGPRCHSCSRDFAILRTIRLETAVASLNSPQNPASECRARAAVGADNEQPQLLTVSSRRRGLQLLWVSTATCTAVLGVVILTDRSD